MADICGVTSENNGSTKYESSSSSNSRAARRKRMEIRRVKFVSGVPSIETESSVKQAKVSMGPATFSLKLKPEAEGGEEDESTAVTVATAMRPTGSVVFVDVEPKPKFGFASVCGRRRDMEDTVAVHPSFLKEENNRTPIVHYFGVYDGHGCSHVATICKDRLHLLVKEELNKTTDLSEWAKTMELSFNKMDKEVVDWHLTNAPGPCRCELQLPETEAVGSTAVVALMTPDKIIVANCGDSRAVLCKGGRPVPLSTDHKPDRPDELSRIQAAGGRVIYWEGARVCGVLAMSRAIGDSYLKPYVICDPEVTITNRSTEDECLIIASDGLWDVVSNETACGVVNMCLNGRRSGSSRTPTPTETVTGVADRSDSVSDSACADASMLLTKLALARRTTDNVSVVVVDLKK